MSRMIFVNLPVEDLDRSIRFYEAIGGRKEPKFSNEAAAMMVLSDTIHVMLLTHEKFAQFTSKPIADAHQSAQVLLAISANSREAVDEITEKALTAGAREPSPVDDYGWMYGRSFEDPDGHHWEPMWMDASAAEQGASALETADATASRH